MLIGGAAAVFAWMLGYGMGGGFRIGGKGGAYSRDETAASGGGATKQITGSTFSTTGGAAGTIEEQLAMRQGKWTKERLRASITAIGHEADMIHAARFTIKLTDQLGPEDFPLALTAIEDAKDELHDEAEIYGMLALARWADLDPKAFGEYLRAQERLGGKWIGPSDLDMALSSWAAKDPLGAIAWVKSLKKEDDQERGIKAILSTVARRDLDEAIAMAKTHAPELLKSDAFADAIGRGANSRDSEKTVRKLAEMGDTVNIKSAIQRWTNQNASAAFQWADELPDEKMRAEALKAAWPQFANAKPEEAAAKLLKAAADAPFIEGTGNTVAKKLAEKDPQAAARWAAALPQREAREEAYATLGEFFGSSKPADGAQWLGGLAPGKERDLAVDHYVLKARGDDPLATTDWAVTIENSERRISALRGTLGEWFWHSPTEAMEWIMTSPAISEEDRQAILKKR